MLLSNDPEDWRLWLHPSCYSEIEIEQAISHEEGGNRVKETVHSSSRSGADRTLRE